MNKTIITTAIAALLTVGVSANLLASSNDAAAKTAQQNAAISMEQAIKIAEQAVGGKATEAEFELEDGVAVYEIEFNRADGSEVEVYIDAQSGVILAQEIEDDDDDGGKDNEREKTQEDEKA